MEQIRPKIWLDISNYVGLYQVSNKGQVKSLKRMKPCNIKIPSKGLRRVQEKILRPIVSNKTGHLVVNLYKDGIMDTRHVHELVLTTFRGSCPPGLQCRHLDDNPANNNLYNLVWGTPKENAADGIRNNKRHRGNKCNWSTITETQVLEVVAEIKHGVKLKSLANKHNVTIHVIKDISRGKSFGWLTGRSISK